MDLDSQILGDLACPRVDHRREGDRSLGLALG